MLYLMSILALFSLVPATPVVVKVEDSSGAALKSELVIVQDLGERESEVFRGLTAEDGKVPPLELHPGLYRAIAVAPYSFWKTEVHEFLVDQKSAEVVLRVEPLPTHGRGDMVIVGAPWLDLQVFRWNGQPAAGAFVLARDQYATLEFESCYKTTEEGKARVELVSDPLVLVVYYGDVLVTKQISGKETKAVIQDADPDEYGARRGFRPDRAKKRCPQASVPKCFRFSVRNRG